MDITVALIALITLSPIMGLVAIAVGISSPGPILFKQQRMGRGGRIFVLYKFRSMRHTYEGSSLITVTGDNRITHIGKVLRRCKLDELPQFWNVLRGDMSLVGPRPKLPQHEGLFMPFRPGITGPATLAFRFEEELLSSIPSEHLDQYYEQFVKPAKANIDSIYMRGASPLTDLEILWQTGISCFSKRESRYRVELPAFRDSID